MTPFPTAESLKAMGLNAPEAERLSTRLSDAPSGDRERTWRWLTEHIHFLVIVVERDIAEKGL